MPLDSEMNNIYKIENIADNNILTDEDSENVSNVVTENADEHLETSNAPPKDFNDSESDTDNVLYKSNRRNNKVLDDSDCEEDIKSTTYNNESDKENVSETTISVNNNKHKRLLIVDSDSEGGIEPVIVHNKSFSDDGMSSSEQPIFVTDSEGRLISENTISEETSQATRLSALCDPESSEDEMFINNEDCLTEEDIRPKQYKKKRVPKVNDEKPKKMTGKEAEKLRREIKSESQRMVREKNISLPYHKPKSYSLKEFLSRRPKFATALPIEIKAPPSVAIKLAAEQLELVSKKLKERGKEVKEFYKSESESESDKDDKDYIPISEIDVGTSQKNTGLPSELTENNHEDENKDDSSQILSSVENSSNTPEEPASLESNIKTINDSEVYESANLEHPKEELGKTSVDDETINRTEELHSVNCANQKNVEQHSDIVAFKESYANEKCLENLQANNVLSETLEIDASKERNSIDYEFNLDGIEENSENVIEKDNTNARSAFSYTDLDKEIEDFGSEPNVAEPQVTKLTPKVRQKSKLDIINQEISHIKPRLTGGPDDIIDLETGIAKPNEVTELIKRYAKHNLPKPVPKNSIQLKITSIESGEIHKETIAMKLDDDNEAIVVEEKPGAKLQKLRDELQNQMAQRRSELWQKKTIKTSNEEKSTYDEEKEDCGLRNDILDDEEEEEIEMTDHSEEDEDEEIENCEIEQEKTKSGFIDEEAEESDEGSVEAVSEEEGADEADDENEIDDVSENHENDDDHEVQPTNKTFRKIVKGFIEDSDEDEEMDINSSHCGENGNLKENTNTASQDDDIPPHQPQTSPSVVGQTTQEQHEYEFSTPVSYITGLQNLNSVTKNMRDEPSPLKEHNWQRSLQEKLYTDAEISDSQVAAIFSDTQETRDIPAMVYTPSEEIPCTSSMSQNVDELVELSSGRFPTSSELTENNFGCQTLSSQDLLNICSGKFTGITQKDGEKPKEIQNSVDTYFLNSNKEVKKLEGDQDLIISQLINEDEMEEFKKKFQSPVTSNNTHKRIVEDFEEAMAAGGVIDSDDDTDTVEVKKKNKKRLMFSDDEDSEVEETEEVIDLHDNIEDDKDSNVAIDNVGYDSEENEIELVDGDAGVNLKPSDFLENEAELSESDWDSADEDEKDLDAMEIELGDSEKYDEKKIRSELEKIHLRRMLDEDNRDVKILQEMLLEDGELHGSGRERQFRWKNINSVDEVDEKKKEDDVYLDEEESEEQWRKQRHEREMFLKEKLKKSQELDEEDLLSESQLLKIGQKVLKRNQTYSQKSTPNSENASLITESPVSKQPFVLLNKRGSFLSRGDHVLQRLAVYNKVTSMTVGSATAKNSRNFLFQSVSVEETASLEKQDKKRKATDGTPNVIKKLRLSNSLSPAVKKKPKAKAKLFGN